MKVFEFIILFVAVISTLYYINYRIILLVKLFVYKEYLNEIPTETEEDIDKFKHSVSKVNGLYKQMDWMETVCYWDLLIMSVSWTINLFLILY